jgi:hypothetical protein
MALIEIDGEVGIERILSLASGDDEARAAARAFVAHADPSHEFAPAITKALRALAAGGPELAAEAVAGLRALDDWSLAPDVATLLAGGHVADPAAAFALKSYLAEARRKDGVGSLRGGE